MGKKSKKGQAGGDFWDEDPELAAETAPVEFGVSNGGDGEASEASPAPESASATPEPEEASGLMSALRKSKKKKDEKEAEAKAEAEKNAAPVVQVKSKKEKEKEKKEREKAKKRAQAERKKTAQKIVPEKKKNEVDDQSADDNEPQEAAQEAPKAAGKGKKQNAIAAALQKKLAAKKAAEEAQRKADEEERQRLEEEAKRLEEEEREREEARLRKKEKERQKREELKAQGKLLTKKQKEQQALQERRRQQLLASGVQVAGLQDSDKPKKPVYGKKKKATKADSATPEPETASKEPSKEPEEVKEPVKEPVKETVEEPAEPIKEPEPQPEEEEVLDDWEAALDSDGEVKEDWEALLDEESKEEKAKEEEKKKQEEEKAKREQKEREREAKLAAERKADQAKAAADDKSVLERGVKMSSARKHEVEEKREARKSNALAHANAKDLRSPICCILGHVDTGKTKLLDKVRQTNVQEGEAGGITQQIGATYFPIDAIEQKTEAMQKYVKPTYNVPGLLVIDTPGHESFTNLRSRGSSLCNIAILVVDIMHGLEPQTLESIRLLRDRKTPFVVALNKIDRLYGWETTPNNSFRDSLAKQSSAVQREFQSRLEQTKLAFAEQGLNSELYYQNKNLSRTVSLVPTSAVTGEGVPDLLYLLLELTQSRMSKQLMYLSELEATILEVKVIEGLGTTIDVVLSNGILREGDRIVLCGMNGPIATNVRAILTPQPLRELRVKSAYVHHKEVKAALGVKIAANDLDKALAGSRLLVVGPDDDEDELMDDVMDDLTGLLESVDTTGHGVSVQASTLGSLEALLDFLKDMKIPVRNISIGPVYKRDVMQAATMLEKNKEFAVMLCFDVKIDKEAEQYAEEQGVKIFNADIIYHLFDEFTAYQKRLLEQRRKDKMADAVYPCVLKTIQVINKRNPMIIGVDILEGSMRIGTPIAIVKTDPGTGEKVTYPLGRIQSMEVNHKSVDHVKKGQANAGVAMRLEAGNANLPTWGRHIDEKDNLYSLITRKSIDTLKDPAFRDGVPRDDWLLIKKLKPIFDIK